MKPAPIFRVNASPAHPLVLTDTAGNQFSIEANTFANGPARSSAQGINGYSGMQLFADDAYSHYHSLQATLSRRWGAGYFQAAYTFSRSTDATSSGNTALNTAFNDETSLDASRGLSDFDRTHRFVVSYRYDLPIFKGATGAKGLLLANWAISGITVFQSGTPFSVTDSGAGTGFLGPGLASATLGANLAPGGAIAAGNTSGDIHQRIDGYLNPANFTSAPLLYPAQCAGDDNFCTTNFGNLGGTFIAGHSSRTGTFPVEGISACQNGSHCASLLTSSISGTTRTSATRRSPTSKPILPIRAIPIIRSARSFPRWARRVLFNSPCAGAFNVEENEAQGRIPMLERDQVPPELGVFVRRSAAAARALCPTCSRPWPRLQPWPWALPLCSSRS